MSILVWKGFGYFFGRLFSFFVMNLMIEFGMLYFLGLVLKLVGFVLIVVRWSVRLLMIFDDGVIFGMCLRM